MVWMSHEDLTNQLNLITTNYHKVGENATAAQGPSERVHNSITHIAEQLGLLLHQNPAAAIGGPSDFDQLAGPLNEAKTALEAGYPPLATLAQETSSLQIRERTQPSGQVLHDRLRDRADKLPGMAERTQQAMGHLAAALEILDPLRNETGELNIMMIGTPVMTNDIEVDIIAYQEKL
jgi:hypothetical protein